MIVREARLDPIGAGSLGAMAAGALRAAIYAGRLKPGDAVRELQVARDLQVSQTTVREALLQLEHAGLVVRAANRGTRVTLLTPGEVRERVEVRIVLETTAALAAARRMTPALFAQLASRVKQIAAAVRRNQYYEAAQADLAFHRIIWQASGNRMLCRMLEDVTAPLFAFISMRQSEDMADLRRRVSSHDPIVAALRAGKSAAIKAAIRDHLAGSYRHFLKNHEGAHDKTRSIG